MPAMAEAMLRFFHCLPDGVQIIASGDDGKQDKERAPEGADDDKGSPRPWLG